MKKAFLALTLFIIVIIVGYVGYYFLFLYNNCHLPLYYSIGDVDPRFKITKEEVGKITETSANRWNEQTSEEIFKFSPKTSSLKINLVYDERQAQVDRTNQQLASLSQTKTAYSNLSSEFQALLSDYQKDLNEYNHEVSQYNNQGGAPSEVYRRLTDEKKNLDQRRNSLISISQSLNLKAQDYNDSLSNLESELNERKNLIITQGIYEPATNTITVYTFGNEDELGLVLMHELGHALKIGHASNPESIMYELLDRQDVHDPQLTAEDKNLLERNCNLPSALQSSFHKIRFAI